MKNTFKKALTFLAIGFAASALTCERANAVPITGDIDFAGEVTFNTQSLATATQVTTFNSAIVTGSTGSFTTVANGSAVTFAAFCSIQLLSLDSPFLARSRHFHRCCEDVEALANGALGFVAEEPAEQWTIS